MPGTRRRMEDIVDIVTYRIVGLSPLLMHSAKAMMQPKPNQGLGSKTIPTAVAEAEAGVYRLPSGQLFIPSESFRLAILGAARGRRIGKTAAAMVLAGSVFPVEPELPLVDPQTGSPIEKYEIDIRRAVVNRMGVARARAMLRTWACDLSFEVDLEMLPNVEILTQILNIAGKIIGVLDYRIEKKGTFGRFRAELISAPPVRALAIPESTQAKSRAGRRVK
jgi:hypothetical protein